MNDKEINDPSPPSTGMQAPSGLKNYIVRHWKGELSLSRSYWANVIGVSAVYSVVLILIAQICKSISVTYAPPIYWSVYLLTGAPVVIWQMVGLWGAARNHIARTGRRLWARVAQIVVVLGTLQAVYGTVPQALNGVVEGIQLAAWLNQNAVGDVTILREGREIQLTGGVGEGLAEKFESTLASAPNAETVDVNLSKGGLLDEAFKIAVIVRARGLDTYTSSSCKSACTIVFLSGKARYLRQGAKLGFHAPKFPGLSEAETNTFNSTYRDYLRKAGISNKFIQRVLSTPATGMWFPDTQTLLSEGIVSAITTGEEYALPKRERETKLAEMRTKLFENRLFVVLKEKEPVLYKKIAEELEASYRKGLSPEEMRNQIASYDIPALREKYLPFAGDKEVVAYFQITVDEATILQKQSGKLCFDYFKGGKVEGVNESTRRALKSTGDRDLDVLVDLMDSADFSRTFLTNVDFRIAMDSVYQDAKAKLGAEAWALDHLHDPLLDESLGCRALIAYFSTILSRPPAHAASILRAAYSPERIAVEH